MVGPEPLPDERIRTAPPGNAWAYVAMAFGLLALVGQPTIFGGIGLILALFAKAWGAPRWRWSVIVVVLCTAAGIALALLQLGAD